MKTRVVVAFAPSLVGLFLLNCSDPALCEGPQCAVATDGGGDGGGDATLGDGGGKTDGAPVGDGSPGKDGGADGTDGSPPTSCNTSADVSSQPACVADAYATFVNGMTGNDMTGNGTKENAFKSIGKAIGASSSGGRVFICATTYVEPVKLTSNVSLYGGFDCSSWAYSTSNVPKVAPSAAGYALDLESVTGVTIEDLEFDSIAGGTPGDSSVAVFAANCGPVSLNRINARAGSGGAQPSQSGSLSNYASSPALDGVTPGTGSTAGVNGPACPACLIKATETSSGGASGSESPGGSAGLDGGPSISGTPGGAGGADNGPSCASLAEIGAASPDGAGGAGAATHGTLAATGWQPTAGQGGTTADVAQGGGGGAGGSTGPGGSGACGGCGGGGGKGGNAGGSSFAILSYQSSLSLISCTLHADIASAGGQGGDGQPGQVGGAGGKSLGNGCNGAGGGTGGSGGGGGGGAGGLSVAIGYVGNKPAMGPDTIATSASGTAAGGGGGAHGSPAAGTGVAGTSAALADLAN